MTKSKTVNIIGAGLSGLASAALLAKKGFQVSVFEKNESPGGRASVFREKGFLVDIGPTWYLMPEIFDTFFEIFGKKVSDYYELEKISPHFKVFFEDGDKMEIPESKQELFDLFDSLEENGAEKLKRYLDEAEYKYEIAKNEFLYKDYKNIFSFFNKRMITEGLKLNALSKLEKYAKKFFDTEKARQILLYNIVFLGSSPKKSPALYSLMSHVDLNIGVFYPRGGIWKLPDAIYKLAKELGVKFYFNHPVEKIEIEKGKAKGIQCNGEYYPSDITLSTAEYPFVQTHLLEKKYQTYPEKYWKKKALAPSMYLLFLGLNKKLKKLEHHNFFLPKTWDKHFENIFDKPDWPENPAYYIGCPSQTDPSVAPKGHELLFMLIPVAPGLNDTDEKRKEINQKLIQHFEKVLGENIQEAICYKKTFAHSDFNSRYNAYQGTALGLAHTLFQSAVFRPKNHDRKINNLFYAGQYTNPGIGVPMAIISAQIIADKIKGIYDEQKV